MSDDIQMYESQIVTYPRGHRLTESDRVEAEQQFIAQALEANPNGTVGNPEFVGASLVIGQNAVFTFRIGLVERGEDANQPSNGPSLAKPARDRRTTG